MNDNNLATTDIDKALSMLAVAVDRMKTARATEQHEDDEWNKKLVRDLTKLAHSIDPKAITSINLLLSDIEMRLVVPNVEYREIRRHLENAYRALPDTSREGRGLIDQALRHLNVLAMHLGWNRE